ncbi:hypothetical protein EB118_20980 [bacterium]|nr:hypothetical protein [bacterium]
MQNKIKIYAQPNGRYNAYLLEADFISAERFYNAIYNFGGTNYKLQDRGSGKAFYFYAEPEKFRRALSFALSNNLESCLSEGDWNLHAEALADQIISEIKPAIFISAYHRKRYFFDKSLDESEKTDRITI